MKRVRVVWAPAGLMGLGALFTVGLEAQRVMPLRVPLAAAVPEEIMGYSGRDVELAEWEKQAIQVDDYVMRVYADSSAGAGTNWFSVYVAYYERQYRDKTIHSPKNCLPGSGWEALASQMVPIAVAGGGTVTVNRYVLQKDDERALALYWYQGRGRVEASEYKVKWDLLRDAALKRRSEEALVRVVVPINGKEDRAFEIAADVAGDLLSAVGSTLPD